LSSVRTAAVDPGLVTEFSTSDGVVHAVDGVSYDVHPGETLGVVGESGSGKSVTVMSILRLIPQPPGRIAAGEIWLEDRNLLDLDEDELREVRGREIAMIFQDPDDLAEPGVDRRLPDRGGDPDP
jgi:oligopeptide transport system ATP-binding protein